MTLHRLLSALLVASVALSACGADDDAQATPEVTTAAAPQTFEHRYGETTLESPPQRIVSLDPQWTDVLVALDAPLVAAALSPVPEGGRFPWQDLPATVDAIPAGDAIPYEAVAAARPDLIVITYYAADETTYDRLSEIAPTIPLLGEEQVDAWQDIAEVAGRLLDREDAAAALVADADQLAADVAAELPGLAGKTYALANYVPGDAIYVVADPDDGAGQLFSALGMEIDPELLALAGGAAGRVELSLERIDELDADLLIILTNGVPTDDIPGYATLPAVESGAVSLLDAADVSGLNTPSPLSIPYALEKIRPALEAAAG